jgi:adenylate kinase
MIKDFDNYIRKEYGKPRNCIIILGPPGSGKGTQADILSTKSGYDHISTGELLRNSKNPRIKNVLKNGGLVPDDLVYKELNKHIGRNTNSTGFIFDGYPRKIEQRDLLEKIMDDNNISISNIFFLNVSEGEIRKRIRERGKTSGRSDDNDKSLEKRISEYKNKTVPLIDSYKNNPDFIEIRSDGAPQHTTKIIFENIPEI